jgi:hypothetical protein
VAAKKGKKNRKGRKSEKSGKSGKGAKGKQAKGANSKKAKKAGAGKRGASARKAPKRKPAASAGPKPVKTGSGPGPLEVATRVAELLRAGNAAQVEQDWLAPSIESVEGHGTAMAWSGKPAVLAKYRGWEADHEINLMSVEGPWVGASGFALRFHVDATQKSTGQNMKLEEIAVYTVRNGKIVREEFHFALPPGA